MTQISELPEPRDNMANSIYFRASPPERTIIQQKFTSTNKPLLPGERARLINKPDIVTKERTREYKREAKWSRRG